MSKPVILTGLRANNDLHIGNYLGALLPMIDMAKTRSNEYQVNLFIPDLHSFTTPIDHSQLQGQIMQNLRLFVAAGLPLDIEDVRIYRQSYVPAHSELTWILDCFSRFGVLARMTQFKDKSQTLSKSRMQSLKDRAKSLPPKGGNADEETDTRNLTIQLNTFRDQIQDDKLKTQFQDLQVKVLTYARDAHKDHADAVRDHLGTINEYMDMLDEAIITFDSSVGLFNYPVLMAADILLYGAKYVPVGDDQTQHLEFTRDIAERMNNQFGPLFTVPLPVPKQHEFFGKDQGLRIKDLVDPTKKMSKSDETGKGVIFLSDPPEVASKKIMSATTDSFGEIKYDMKGRPGVSNLLQMLALLSQRELSDVTAEWEGKTSYGDLKKAVATVVGAFLTEFQTRLADVQDSVILAKLEKDEAAMRGQANATLLKVQRAVGLRPAN